MKNKILVVFNTCGIRSGDNIRARAYVQTLNNIVAQQFDGFQVVLSSCLNSQTCINTVAGHLRDRISYNLIHENLPVAITFNHSVRNMVNRFGEFDIYMYVDSGMTFEEGDNILQNIYDVHIQSQAGITSTRIVNDYSHPNQIDALNTLHQSSNDRWLTLPMGFGLNGHVHTWDNTIYQAYDKRILPDVFSYHCQESIYTYMAAGIGRRYVVINGFQMNHFISLDGESSGTYLMGLDPRKPHWNYTFRNIRDMTKVISDPEAKLCGFGYEEVEAILPHNPECYDNQGNCKDPNRLKEFIRKNVFLSAIEFDYKTVQHEFTPCETSQ